MLKKLNSQNMFSIGNEDHTTEPAKELDEQGVIMTADAEEVVAPITPSEDVQEAGDDIGQATPKEEIGADDKADITTTAVEETPGVTVIESSTDGSNAEVTELLQEGADAATAKDEIVQAAITEATDGADVDVNGNTVTPEQAAENEAEAEVVEEVDEEEEEQAAAKDIHQEAAQAEENATEELGDAVADDVTDAVDGGDTAEGTDDTSSNLGGDDADLGMDPDEGSISDPSGGDDIEADDDTPLEGAEVVEEEEVADAQPDGDTATDSTDDVADTSVTEDSAVDDSESTDESADIETTDETDTDGALEETEDTSVDEQIEDQNAAADVTAEAASSDADQTEFIAGETPEQHGVEPDSDIVPNDGEEVVAEAKPAVQNTEDVSTINSTQDVEDGPDDETSDDDVPLDGAEPLDVNAEEDLTPKGQDLGDSDPTAATVEESTTDQTAEELDEQVADAEDANSEVAEDAGEVDDSGITEETTIDSTGDETTTETSDVTEDVVEDGESVPVEEVGETVETTGPDTDAGEVEETDDEPNFDEGEIDVKDVDTTTTDEDVEEAMADAAEVGEWGDAEAADADLADKTIEELQKEKESLESFRARLEVGIATESFSPGLLSVINDTLEPLRKRFAELDPSTPARVALEDYTGKDLDLAYQASLESLRGVLSRITTASHAITHQVEKWWARGMIDKVTSRSDALDKQVDVLLVKLKDSDYSTEEITGIRGYLSTTERSLLKAVADDLAVTTDIAVKGIKATEGLQNTLVKALNDIIGAGSKEEIDKALDAVAKLKDTKAAFPKTAFDRGLLGGYKFEMRERKGSDRTAQIENVGHAGIPVAVKTKDSSDNSTFKLSKADIANLLKLAKAYLGLARKLANTTGDRAVDSVSKIRTTRDRSLPIGADSRVKGDEYGVDATATALKLTAKAHVDLYKFLTKHCNDVAEALCGVAKKAVK